MRFSRRASLIGALALVVALSVGTIASAGEDTEGTVTQSLEATVKPTKLPKKKAKAKPVDLNIAVGIRDSSGQKPPSANKVNVNLSNDLYFDTEDLDTCAQSQIEGTTTDAAKQQCGKAVVGSGSASATLSGNTNPPDIPKVDVTAFNGEPKGKNPVLLLHTVADLGGGSSQTTILPGVLKKGKGDFGNVLQVTVPPLAGGVGSIIDFETTVGKSEVADSKNGKDYVTATCKNKKMQFGGDFFYNSNPQGVSQLNPTDEVTCKQA